MKMTVSLVLAAGALCLLVGFAGAQGIELKECATVDIGGRKATVATYDVLPYRETSLSKACVYDTYGNPKLATLRERYELDAVVAPGKTELERQALLMHWAKNCFDLGEPKREVAPGRFENMAGWRNALNILALAEKEQKFFCTHYANVLVSAAASLGWVCRPLEHSTHTWTEMWSNQYGRWVHFDPTSDYYWEKGGIPIDTYGAQAAVAAGAKDLVVVVNGRKTRNPVRAYTFYHYITNTNQMDVQRGYGRFYHISVADNRGGFSSGNLTDADAASVALFPINQAALSFAAADGGLAVTMKTMTPNFKTFMVRIDGGEWKGSGESFTWKLHGGKNALEAKTVNLFGVDGSVSTVVLEVTP